MLFPLITIVMISSGKNLTILTTASYNGMCKIVTGSGRNVLCKKQPEFLQYGLLITMVYDSFHIPIM